MTLLDKEPVKRVEKRLKEFDPKQRVIILDTVKAHPLKYAMNTLESHYYPPNEQQLLEGLNDIQEHYERYICK